jgi:protein FAM32A
LHYARKKKKAKSKADDEKNRERDRVKELLLKEDDTVKTGSPSGSSRNSPAVGGSNDKKTDAERRFEEVQKRRVSGLHN